MAATQALTWGGVTICYANGYDGYTVTPVQPKSADMRPIIIPGLEGIRFRKVGVGQSMETCQSWNVTFGTVRTLSEINSLLDLLGTMQSNHYSFATSWTCQGFSELNCVAKFSFEPIQSTQSGYYVLKGSISITKVQP